MSRGLVDSMYVAVDIDGDGYYPPFNVFCDTKAQNGVGVAEICKSSSYLIIADPILYEIYYPLIVLDTTTICPLSQIMNHVLEIFHPRMKLRKIPSTSEVVSYFTMDYSYVSYFCCFRSYLI